MRTARLVLLGVALLALFMGLRSEVGQIDWQLQMLLPADFDTNRPEFSRIGEQRHVLLFSKTNGYRRHTSIAAAQQMFEQIAAERSWFVYVTENAAIFSAETLGEFDSVVFNNVSGPLFTADQRATLAAFVDRGGGLFNLRDQPTDATFRNQLAERIRRVSPLGQRVSRPR